MSSTSLSERRKSEINEESTGRIVTAPLIPQQASTDQQVIELWLHGKADDTKIGYRLDTRLFFETLACLKGDRCQLTEVTLADLQAWFDALIGSQNSKARYLASVRSLFAFAHKIGYLRWNPAAVMRKPKTRNKLAERILDRATIIRIIESEKNPRNYALMRLLYVSGLRANEARLIKGKDLIKHEDGGQINVIGKGGKEFSVWVSEKMFSILNDQTYLFRPVAFKENLSDNGSDRYVFRTRTGRALTKSHVNRIVRAAAKRAKVERNVSPHWFRHAYASHLLDAGVGVYTIKQLLNHESLAATERYLHARPRASEARMLEW